MRRSIVTGAAIERQPGWHLGEGTILTQDGSTSASKRLRNDTTQQRRALLRLRPSEVSSFRRLLRRLIRPAFCAV